MSFFQPRELAALAQHQESLPPYLQLIIAAEIHHATPIVEISNPIPKTLELSDSVDEVDVLELL